MGINRPWRLSPIALALRSNIPSIKVLSYPYQQISQPVPRENHSSVGNPLRTNNVSGRKHGNRCNHSAILASTPWSPNELTVSISNLRRNLEALFRPLKVSARQFGELFPLKILAVSERRSLVLQP